MKCLWNWTDFESKMTLKMKWLWKWNDFESEMTLNMEWVLKCNGFEGGMDFEIEWHLNGSQYDGKVNLRWNMHRAELAGMGHHRGDRYGQCAPGHLTTWSQIWTRMTRVAPKCQLLGRKVLELFSFRHWVPLDEWIILDRGLSGLDLKWPSYAHLNAGSMGFWAQILGVLLGFLGHFNR